MNKLLKFLPLLLLPFLASAHGLVTTQSQTTGNYTVEFEYNTVGNILTGDYTLYDGYLLDSTTRDGIDFDSAFIRIAKQNGPAVIGANLAESPDIKGYASLSGVIAEPGTYETTVSFYKDSKTLAESKFNFTVEQNQDYTSASKLSKNHLLIVVYIVGVLMGAAGFWVIKKNLKKE
jgi:hypothetical protein